MIKRIGAIILTVAILTQGLTSYADSEPVLIKKRATAYCLKGITSTGTQVRSGVAASGDQELIGKTIVMYQRLPGDKVGKIIGIYQVEDSGCSKHVIDVWHEDLERCQQFMDTVYEDGCQGKIYIQIWERACG